jgi:hypothetical protein
MYPLQFDKTMAEKFVNALRKGEAIEAPPGGWTTYEMLMLAGACYFGAWSHGPTKAMDLPAELREAYLKKQHPEHQEADWHNLKNDLSAVVEFCGELSAHIADGRYDDTLEALVSVLISKVGDEGKASFVSGLKSKPTEQE